MLLFVYNTIHTKSFYPFDLTIQRKAYIFMYVRQLKAISREFWILGLFVTRQQGVPILLQELVFPESPKVSQLPKQLNDNVSNCYYRRPKFGIHMKCQLLKNVVRYYRYICTKNVQVIYLLVLTLWSVTSSGYSHGNKS